MRNLKSAIITIIFQNYLNRTSQPPSKPHKPSGPSSGKINIEQTYSTFTTDPENDQLYYLWDWGDGTDSGWLGPYDSGENCAASHTWKDRGNYDIKVKAKDIYGIESEWSDPLAISMAKKNGYNNPMSFSLS